MLHKSQQTLLLPKEVELRQRCATHPPAYEIQLLAESPRVGDDTLAAISYNGLQLDPYLGINISATPLGEDARVEVWRSRQPVTRGQLGGIHYAYDQDILLAWLVVPSHQESLEASAFQGYAELITSLRQLGYPHLVRVWNYLPRINAVDHGLERYQSFCLGRHRAFFDYAALQPDHLPAASAVGTRDEQLKIVALAAKQPGLAQENPRQVSAYHYPRRYGPASPSFARATLIKNKNACYFFVSGTASIVGHESLHSGDVGAQLDTLLINIQRLLEHTARRHAMSIGVNNINLAKVYIRRRADFQPIQAALRKFLPASTSLLYLEADICREELEVEVELVCTLD